VEPFAGPWSHVRLRIVGKVRRSDKNNSGPVGRDSAVRAR